MHWVRKPGVSATAAMDAFSRGLTIADCASVAAAVQVAALRAALGDDQVRPAFGGEGSKPRRTRTKKRYTLEIGQGFGSSVVADLMRATESATMPGTQATATSARRAALLHQPSRLSEEASHRLLAGRERDLHGREERCADVTGFGAPEQTEEDERCSGQGVQRAPTPEDLAKRKRLYDKHGADVANWPDDVKKFHGEGPAEIKVPDLLAAGGGFQAKEGKELDPAKVQPSRIAGLMIARTHVLVLPAPRVRLGQRSFSWFHVCGLAGGAARRWRGLAPGCGTSR